LDAWAIILDMVSAGLLALAFLTARWALLGFKQSKQALREAASYVSVIVSALSSRIQALEGTIGELRKSLTTENHRAMNLEDAEAILQSKYEELSKQIQELIADHKKLLHSFEEIESRLTVAQRPIPTEPSPVMRSKLPEDAALNRLTSTERETLQMLSQGALPAPELGRRLDKSREHMARLMKKLYLEGYVDRESERPPFKYKLNDKLRLSIGDSISASPSEKT
jgi:chromosome segregation ATPase